MANDFLTFKGKPLVRKGNEIYYGDMSEKYVIKLEVLAEGEVDGNTVPTKVSIQLMLSDTQLPEKDRVKKKSEKAGFYEALDLGVVWLERALKD